MRRAALPATSPRRGSRVPDRGAGESPAARAPGKHCAVCGHTPPQPNCHESDTALLCISLKRKKKSSSRERLNYSKRYLQRRDEVSARQIGGDRRPPASLAAFCKPLQLIASPTVSGLPASAGSTCQQPHSSGPRERRKGRTRNRIPSHRTPEQNGPKEPPVRNVSIHIHQN